MNDSDLEGVPERRQPWMIGFSVLLIVLVVLLRFSAHLSLGDGAVDHDWYTMHAVDAVHVEQAAQEGQWLATWSPHILGGSPLWAVSTKPFSYPPFLIFVRLFGAFAAMNLLLLLHMAWGSIGTFFLGRRIGLRGMAPTLCALLFVLARFPANGFEATPYGFGYAIAWWPWTLIALLDLLEERRVVRAALLLGTCSAMQWHAGGQPSLYWLICFASCFVVPWVLKWNSGRQVLSAASGLLLAGSVFLGLVAVKLLPELSWLEHSGRGVPLGMDFARDSAIEVELQRSGGTSRLVNLGALLAAQFKGACGWVLLLAGGLGVSRGVRRRSVWALSLGTVFAFVLASGAMHDLAYDWLPGYDRMRRHSRFVHIVGFGLILLAGHGLEFRGKGLRGKLLAGLLVLAVLVDGSVLPMGGSSEVRLRSMAEQNDLFARMLAPVLEEDRLGRLQDAHRNQTAWVSLGLDASGGALGGPNSGNVRYHEYLDDHASAKVLQRSSPGALDVMNVRYLASAVRIPGSGLEPVATPDDLGAGTQERLTELGVAPLYVYRRSSLRARLVGVDSPTLVVGSARARRQVIRRLVAGSEFQARAEVYLETPGQDLRRTDPDRLERFARVLFLGLSETDPRLLRWSEERPESSLEPHKNGTLWRSRAEAESLLSDLEDERYSRGSNWIEVDLDGLPHEFLLLSELSTLNPGWSATMDGEPAELLRADGLATMVRLPAGAKRLRLDYSPPGLRLGAWISALTLLGMVGGVILRRVRRVNT